MVHSLKVWVGITLDYSEIFIVSNRLIFFFSLVPIIDNYHYFVKFLFQYG